MQLSELEIGKSNQVLVDAEFEHFGLLSSSSLNAMITYLESEDFICQLDNKEIKAVICKPELVSLLPKHIQGIIISDNPMPLFWKLHNYMGNSRCEKYNSRIGQSCTISSLASISPDNVIIGNNVVIEDFVSIKDNVVIGDNVIIRSGSIIGGNGFEVKRLENSILSIEHYGGVIIQDNVEIQQLVSIQKGVFFGDNTFIGADTKIADMTLISHGCKVGKKCFFAGRSTLCGSVTVNDNVWIGPSSTIVNGLTIGKDAYIGLGSIVRKSVDSGMAVLGDKVMSMEKYNAIRSMCNK